MKRGKMKMLEVNSSMDTIKSIDRGVSEYWGDALRYHWPIAIHSFCLVFIILILSPWIGLRSSDDVSIAVNKNEYSSFWQPFIKLTESSKSPSTITTQERCTYGYFCSNKNTHDGEPVRRRASFLKHTSYNRLWKFNYSKLNHRDEEMARIRGNNDVFCDAPHSKFGWKYFRGLSRDNNTSDESNCNCASSDPEITNKKSSKNRSRKLHTSAERRDRSGRKVKVGRSRKKIRDKDMKKPEQSSPARNYPSLCDEPRKVKRSYKKTDTTHYSPNVMQVKSVEVIKSWSMERCRAKYSDEKIIKKRKKLKKKKISGKPKSSNRKHSNSSESSGLSSSSGKEYIKSQSPSSHNKIYKNNNKMSIEVVEQKSNEKNCPCCDSLMEAVKSSRVPTYPKSNRRREVSRERIYKRKESPRPLEGEFAKKHETMQKVRGESQMESWSRGSQCKTQKLCRMLKTREARRFMGCHCIESDDRVNSLVNCQCPECPYDLNMIDDMKNVKQTHEENSKRIVFNDSEICPSELDLSTVCTCRKPQLENQCRNTKSSSDNRNRIESPNLTDEFLQQYRNNDENPCKKYHHAAIHLREMYQGISEIGKTRKTITKCVTQRVVDNLQRQCNNDEILSGKRRDAATLASSHKETTNRVVQCDEHLISSNIGRNRSNGDQDPVEAVASLCEKLIMINREIKPQCGCRSSSISSPTVQCKREPTVHDEYKEKSESNHNIQYLKDKKSKQRMRFHRFTFPKIVKGESNNETSDVPKMFVYSGDDEDAAPLSLYKTGSFVKCSIKRNNNIGNKYYVAYIQKYVSPAWKSNDNNETETKSTDHLSSDDYG